MSRTRSILLTTTLLLAAAATPAHAVSKEMIQLQTQIQQLQDAVARLQQSNDERMGVMKDLVQQTADSVNKMSVTVNGLKLQMQNVQDASATKSDQLSSQVQALNDSLDEVKARLAKMERSLSDIQSQQQSTAAALQNQQPAIQPQTGGQASNNPAAPAAGQPIPTEAPVTRTAPPQTPVADMYRAAYSDYMAARYPLASSEFSDLIKAYPDDNLAGNAHFYLGEIDLRTQKPTDAIKQYDRLLERYPDNNKIPAARLHKGEALIATNKTAAGTVELKALIARYPQSPEAAQAKARLATLRSAASR
jgi:tol-pal system protein YbgF